MLKTKSAFEAAASLDGGKRSGRNVQSLKVHFVAVFSLQNSVGYLWLLTPH